MRKMQGIFIEMYKDRIVSAFGTNGRADIIRFTHPYLRLNNYTVVGAILEMVNKAYQNGYYIPFYMGCNCVWFNVWVHRLDDDVITSSQSFTTSDTDRWKKYGVEKTLVDSKFLKRGEMK